MQYLMICAGATDQDIKERGAMCNQNDLNKYWTKFEECVKPKTHFRIA